MSECDQVHPQSSLAGSVFRLPAHSIRVTDTEEELFLLYTRLSSSGSQDGSKPFTGLGSVNSRQDTLTVSFELPPGPCDKGDENSTTMPFRRSAAKRKRKAAAKDTTRLLEVQLAQDKTSLRSRKGDTGSVLWRVCVDFAQSFLNWLGDSSATSLVDAENFSRAHVLELGAGTGLLSMVTSPWSERYTATDLDYLLPLVRKNIALNISQDEGYFRSLGEKLSVDSLDWVHLLGTPLHSRPSIFPEAQTNPFDIIFAVDCIFNPHLLPALVETIDYFSVPGKTATVVVLELRAEDVVRDFLNLWLAKEGWEIWRPGGDALADWAFPQYAMWIGWKTASEYTESLSTA